MLAQHGALQRIRAFQYNGIVVGRVHFRVAYGEVLAAVDVDAVAVGVDGHVVDGADVAARGDDGKVATAKDGDVTDGDVATQLQGDGLVARAYGAALHVAGLLGIMLCQAFTVNHPVTRDADVLLPLGPNERIMEIGVAAVLVFREATKRLTLIVGLHRGWSSQNLCPCHQVQIDVALQPDTATEICACRQHHLSSAISRRSLYRLVDSNVVERHSVTLGSIIAYIIHSRCCRHSTAER